MMHANRILFVLLTMVVSTLALAAPTHFHSRNSDPMPLDITFQYPQIKNALQSHFLAENVQLLQGTSMTSLVAAQYQETAPLVAVVIADDQTYLYLYLETCDICAVLARAAKDGLKVEILRQDHSFSSSDLKQELLKFQIKSSIWDSANR